MNAFALFFLAIQGPLDPISPQHFAPQKPDPLQWHDMDGDGDFDAVAIDVMGKLRVLLNEGDGRFVEPNSAWKLEELNAGLAIHAAVVKDFDLNGSPDLLVSGGFGVRLWVSVDGQLQDQTLVAGLADLKGVRVASWVDVDGDERADLHLEVQGKQRVFRNLADGSFEELDLGTLGGVVLSSGDSSALGQAGLDTGSGGEVSPGVVNSGQFVAGSVAGVAVGSKSTRNAAPAPTALAATVTGPNFTANTVSPPPANLTTCVESLKDQGNGGCLEASSTPTEGMLFPLGVDLMVASDGKVGIGTLTPGAHLEVIGSLTAGFNNVATGALSSVLGGEGNQALGYVSTVCGGFDNFSTESQAVVAGGSNNLSSGAQAAIVGGGNNQSSGQSAFVGAGQLNESSGDYSAVVGGFGNIAAGDFSAVLGGQANQAPGSHSVAAGQGALAGDNGSFVWADFHGISNVIPFASTDENQFLIRADGGVGIGTNAPAMPLHVDGGFDVELASGGYVQIGSSTNLAMDNNEIMVRSGGQADTLFLNNNGGDVSIGGKTNGGSKLGVNVTDPEVALHVVEGTDVGLAGGGLLQMGAQAGQNLALDENEIMARNGGNTSRLSLNSDGGDVAICGNSVTGQVGIGTSFPLDRLDVVGNIRSRGADGGLVAAYNPANQGASVALSWLDDVARIRVGGSGAGALNGLDIQGTGNNSLLRLSNSGLVDAEQVRINGGSASFTLSVNGSAGKPGGGLWSVTSDARLKKDVESLDGALDTLMELRGVTYEYIDPEAINELPGRQTGFIAQEVQGVLPDWVAEGEDGYLRLQIRGFTALAVEALRELRAEKDAEVAFLREKLNSRDAQLARLAERLEKLEQVVGR